MERAILNQEKLNSKKVALPSIVELIFFVTYNLMMKTNHKNDTWTSFARAV